MNVQLRYFRVLFAATLAAMPVGGQEARDTLDVFFIGNSYTYFNNLPGLLESVSQGLDGPYLRTAGHTHPGHRLGGHLTDGHLPGAFWPDGATSRTWDFVVLQEQSALATVTDTVTGELGSPIEFQESVRGLAAQASALGAAPALYMTWAKKRWPHQIEAISAAYRTAGAALGAPVAPVGEAWAAANARRPELDLFVADGSHPNPAGSYLAACVIYATLTGENPVGAPREVWGAPWNGAGPMESETPTLLVSLTPDDAVFLQEVAWEIVNQ